VFFNPYFYVKLFYLSSINKLATQTLWYGVSTIAQRMLSYLLTPLLTSIFVAGDFGKITTVFAVAAFLNIIYSFGMETAYFRFLNEEKEEKVFNAAFKTILIITLAVSAVLWMNAQIIADLIKIPDHPEYIQWVIIIVILDNLSVLPFAKLRHTGRPVKYAFIKLVSILLQIGLVYFWYFICKNATPGSLFFSFYDSSVGPGYVFLANVFASALAFLLLFREWISFRWESDPVFWKKIIQYSLPLLLVGFGGMVNELIDRFMLINIYPGTVQERYTQTGIYSANYKLAVIIALFIQAFRLGAEPFFFKHSTQSDAPKIYARVMNFFVITCCLCFLSVVLFLDYWKYFMGKTDPAYWTGLKVVPVLLIAKIFLGMYYNLSVWYKITNKNMTGAWITIGGVVITLVVNYLLVPYWGYMGCAVATLCCYSSMMLASYYLGQKHFPVPYDWKRIVMYIGLVLLIFICHQWTLQFISHPVLRFLDGVLFGIVFLTAVILTEKNELVQLPFFKKWLR
jgi:hypothetical protein